MLLLALVSPGCLADETLYRLLNERLGWMQQVAAWKWQRDLPIENVARENVVINQAVDAGLRAAITPASSRAFFIAQIEAAKAIQACWYVRWQQQPPTGKVADLNEVIRPELIRLGNAISQRLALHQPDRQQFDALVQTDCLADEFAGEIFAALAGIQTYPDRLTQIRDSGILRVGTTGDYAPFSHTEDGSTFTGIDVDLARDLARSLGVEPVFVHTSWPTLMQDLAASRYDIAMSGVSRIPAREQVAGFSAAYHVGGKTPISRCENIGRFTTLTQIDSPEVRIIVNPGGTNERFVRRKLSRAQVILFQDNRAIFDEIVSGRADLMITDSIEVKLQSARNPALCATMPGQTLTYQEKAYMMPMQASLVAAVNQWLESARASGLLARTFDKHLR